jgi:hypothetical protein
MLKSEAERVVRRAVEEVNAQFTEEQLKALCTMIVKIVDASVEEALSSWRPSGGKSGY